MKTDGFCPGAAGPIFCSLSLAFLGWSAVGRRWKSGLRESRLRRDGLPAVYGEFDLQRVVTQEELVKRDTSPGCVHSCGFALERAHFADHDGSSLGVCFLQGYPGFGVSRRPGANRCCRDLEVAPLSFGFCPCGPLVHQSDRFHAKLEFGAEADRIHAVSECAGETYLPHTVSESF